jgi:hypothetical protein
MSYTRTLDTLTGILKDTREKAPCEAAETRLMLSAASGWHPADIGVQEGIINDFDDRIAKVPRKDQDKFCSELMKTPHNILQTIEARGIGGAQYYFGKPESEKRAGQAITFFKTYERLLDACRGTDSAPTPFYNKLNQDQRDNLNSVTRSAQSKAENLADFQMLHRRCIGK